MFEKVLVANRGEIALRILRTCRRLGLKTVSVYSDADALAPHVRFADEALRVGPSRAQDSYLNLSAITDAVRESGADAVHPGYGLLSEDASLARAIEALGVVFVGPSAENLERFGDKLKARQFAASVGIASPPGTQKPVSAEQEEVLLSSAEQLGYPVLVKAAAGGGGIGMQPAQGSDELLKAARTCATRSQAAFGDDRIYLERYFEAPRHIEVQVLADGFGRAIALGERECSAQRRHQKVLEEAPCPARALSAPAASGTLRSQLHASAVRLLSAANYRGVGTVEFLADLAGPEPRVYFLEVNARLQVEHPVTELLFGVDLVEQQLRVAAGEPLDAELARRRPRGHAIEVRLYAEDPERGFLPQPGRLQHLEWPEGALEDANVTTSEAPLLRVDAGYEQGDEISPFYDPLIAKLIAWGPDRTAAATTLAAGLGDTRVQLEGPKGPRRTNLSMLRTLVLSQELLSGEYDTGVLERVIRAQ